MGTRLLHKTALVTGATSNIGRAIAVRFAAEGARVIVSGRDSIRGDQVVSEIMAAGGDAAWRVVPSAALNFLQRPRLG